MSEDEKEEEIETPPVKIPRSKGIKITDLNFDLRKVPIGSILKIGKRDWYIITE